MAIAQLDGDQPLALLRPVAHRPRLSSGLAIQPQAGPVWLAITALPATQPATPQFGKAATDQGLGEYQETDWVGLRPRGTRNPAAPETHLPTVSTGMRMGIVPARWLSRPGRLPVQSTRRSSHRSLGTRAAA